MEFRREKFEEKFAAKFWKNFPEKIQRFVERKVRGRVLFRKKVWRKIACEKWGLKISEFLEKNLREIAASTVVGLAWICVRLGFGFGFVGKFLPWAVAIVAGGGAIVLGKLRAEQDEKFLEKFREKNKKNPVLPNLLGWGLLLWPVAVAVEKYLDEPLWLVRIFDPVAVGAAVLVLGGAWRWTGVRVPDSRALPGNQNFCRWTGQIFGAGEILVFVVVAVGAALWLREFGSVAVVVAGFAWTVCVFLARVVRNG